MVLWSCIGQNIHRVRVCSVRLFHTLIPVYIYISLEQSCRIPNIRKQYLNVAFCKESCILCVVCIFCTLQMEHINQSSKFCVYYGLNRSLEQNVYINNYSEVFCLYPKRRSPRVNSDSTKCISP